MGAALASGPPAIAPVVSTVKQSTNGTSVTSDPMDTTGTHLIVIRSSGATTGTPYLPTDSKGNFWSTYGYLGGGGQPSVWTFYCKDPIVGPGHTFTVATTKPTIEVEAYKNAGDLDGQTAFSSGGAAAATRQPGSYTPTIDNCLIITAMGKNDTVAAVGVDSGFTMVNNVAGNANSYGQGSAYKTQTAKQAVNPTWSMSPNDVSSTVQTAFRNRANSVAPGAVFDWDALDLNWAAIDGRIIIDGNDINSWKDKKALRNIQQATAGLRPIYKAAITPKGKGVARFDGVDDGITSGGLTPCDVAHIFMVMAYRPASLGGGNQLFFYGRDATVSGLELYLYISSGVLRVQTSAGQGAVFVNGVSTTVIPTNGVFAVIEGIPLAPFTHLDTAGMSAGALSVSPIDVCRVVGYSTVQTGADLAQTRAALTSLY